MLNFSRSTLRLRFAATKLALLRFRRFHVRQVFCRGISIGLVLSLLVVSTPAAPQTIVAVARESSVSFAFWFRTSGLARMLQDGGAGAVRPQEKQRDRDALVSRIQIYPGDLTVNFT